jgi:hypothetical protein
MRRSFSSFFRLIACFLVMTVLTSGIAMAAYVCPQLVKAPVQKMAMGDMPCAEMDKEKPVHCAEHQSGGQLTLEHLAAAPSFGPTTVSFVMPAPAPIIPLVLTSFWTGVPLQPVTDPPYLRTQRLRI